jgi:hypothetical protein
MGTRAFAGSAGSGGLRLTPLAASGSGGLARAMVLMKQERIEPLGAWFRKRLLEAAERIPPQFAPDLVVLVPLRRTQQKEGGFNQVDLWAASGTESRAALPASFMEAGASPAGETSPSF